MLRQTHQTEDAQPQLGISFFDTAILIAEAIDIYIFFQITPLKDNPEAKQKLDLLKTLSLKIFFIVHDELFKLLTQELAAIAQRFEEAGLDHVKPLALKILTKSYEDYVENEPFADDEANLQFASVYLIKTFLVNALEEFRRDVMSHIEKIRHKRFKKELDDYKQILEEFIRHDPYTEHEFPLTLLKPHLDQLQEIKNSLLAMQDMQSVNLLNMHCQDLFQQSQALANYTLSSDVAKQLKSDMVLFHSENRSVMPAILKDCLNRLSAIRPFFQYTLSDIYEFLSGFIPFASKFFLKNFTKKNDAACNTIQGIFLLKFCFTDLTNTLEREIVSAQEHINVLFFAEMDDDEAEMEMSALIHEKMSHRKLINELKSLLRVSNQMIRSLECIGNQLASAIKHPSFTDTDAVKMFDDFKLAIYFPLKLVKAYSFILDTIEKIDKVTATAPGMLEFFSQSQAISVLKEIRHHLILLLQSDEFRMNTNLEVTLDVITKKYLSLPRSILRQRDNEPVKLLKSIYNDLTQLTKEFPESVALECIAANKA